MSYQNNSWSKYLQEKMDINVTVTDDEPEVKDKPFDKKSNKEKVPFGKKADKKEDAKKPNPFAKKSDKKKEGEKPVPFAKKSEKGEKKDNPFFKKNEWTSMFPTWQEWVEVREV